MRKTRRRFMVFLVTAAAAAWAAGTGHAQNVTTDFSGEWTVVRSQDNTENPWVGDFFGLPLNADGLARSETWDASLLSLPEYQCRPHGWAYIYRGPTATAHQQGSRSVLARDRRLSARVAPVHEHAGVPRRPRTSTGRGGALVGRLLDGAVGRRHAADRNVAPQGRLHSPRRRDGHRRSHRDDVVDPPRRHPDVGQHHPRSDLPRRAADPQLGVPAERELTRAAASLHLGLRRPGKGQSAAFSRRARTPSSRTFARGTALPRTARPAASRRSIPSTSRS